jgi:hypothetical protein
LNIYGGKYGPVIPLSEPGHCAICKSAPDLKKKAMIDTLGDIRGVLHDRPMPAAFQGRIYVCEDCANVIGRLVQYGKPEYEQLLTAHNAAVERNVELENELANFESLRHVAELIVNSEDNAES